MLISFVLVGQQVIPPTEWKEYKYPQDGFAITFPYAPSPHADAVNPGMTVYTIRLTPQSAISIRSKPAANCGSELRDAVKATASQLGDASPRFFSVAGHDAFEDERKNGDHWSYMRLWCGDKEVFSASLRWPLNESKPAAALRILNSFRIIPGE